MATTKGKPQGEHVGPQLAQRNRMGGKTIWAGKGTSPPLTPRLKGQRAELEST